MRLPDVNEGDICKERVRICISSQKAIERRLVRETMNKGREEKVENRVR